MKRKYLAINILVLMVSIVHSQSIYVSTQSNKLYTFDVKTCNYNFLVSVEAEMFDITFHPNGNLYGVSGEGAFFEIDTITGDTSHIYSFQGQVFNSMTSDREGIIYLTGTNGNLLSYDIANDQVLDLGNFGHGATGDLTFYGGELYAAVRNDKIIAIDIENPGNSRVFINGSIAGDIFGIVSYAEDCSAIKTYALTGGRSTVYEINFDNRSLKEVCRTGLSTLGGASKYEFIASDPIIIEEINKSHPVCGESDGSINIKATGGKGDLNYSLDGLVFQSIGFFEELAGDIYTILITDAEGCEARKEIYLYQEDCPIYFPNVFTPNNDGHNDTFKIFPHPGYEGSFKSLRIFDRWGSTIYEVTNLGIDQLEWNGKTSGQPVLSGVYIYILEVERIDGTINIYKGDVTVIQ